MLPVKIQTLKCYNIFYLWRLKRIKKKLKVDTPLHVAAENGFYQLIELLLRHGAKSKRVENTPLHSACETDSVKSVQILISHGANIQAENRKDETPFCTAVRHNSVMVMDYLITMVTLAGHL